MPWVRHTSATFRPASPSFTIARICSSVNLLRFIGASSLSEDPHSTRGGLLGAGHTDTSASARVVRVTAGALGTKKGPSGNPEGPEKNPGSDLLSHAVTRTVPSAVAGLTSVFG